MKKLVLLILVLYSVCQLSLCFLQSQLKGPAPLSHARYGFSVSTDSQTYVVTEPNYSNVTAKIVDDTATLPNAGPINAGSIYFDIHPKTDITLKIMRLTHGGGAKFQVYYRVGATQNQHANPQGDYKQILFTQTASTASVPPLTPAARTQETFYVGGAAGTFELTLTTPLLLKRGLTYGFYINNFNDATARLRVSSNTNPFIHPQANTVFHYFSITGAGYSSTGILTKFDTANLVATNNLFMGELVFDTLETNYGRVHVYERGTSLDTLSLVHTLGPDVPTRNKFFGYSASVHDNALVVGAPYGGTGNNGEVYIFERRSNNKWGQKLLISRPAGLPTIFGAHVVVHRSLIAIGSLATTTGAGSILVYERNAAGNWLDISAQFTTNFDPDSRGRKSAIYDKYIVFCGIRECEVFEDIGATWASRGLLVPGGPAGALGINSVAIWDRWIAVGQPTTIANGRVILFHRTGNVWSRVQVITTTALNANFGFSVSMHKERLAVGASGRDDPTDSGGIYLFKLVGPTNFQWSLVSELTSNEALGSERLGTSVSITGDVIISGAFNANKFAFIDRELKSVEPFLEEGGANLWVISCFDEQLIGGGTNTNELYGVDVDVVKNIAAVSAPGNGNGAVSLYSINALTGDWVIIRRVTGPAVNSRFGFAIDLCDNFQGSQVLLIVGIPHFDTATPTIRRGSARIYDVAGGAVTATLNPPAPADVVANLRFGIDVQIDQHWAAVGAPGIANPGGDTGRVYIYHFRSSTTTWTLVTSAGEGFISSSFTSNRISDFGSHIAMDLPYVVVGINTYREITTNVQNFGRVEMFELRGFMFDPFFEVEAAINNPDNVDAPGQFGVAVAIYQDEVVVGAPFSGTTTPQVTQTSCVEDASNNIAVHAIQFNLRKRDVLAVALDSLSFDLDWTPCITTTTCSHVYVKIQFRIGAYNAGGADLSKTGFGWTDASTTSPIYGALMPEFPKDGNRISRITVPRKFLNNIPEGIASNLIGIRISTERTELLEQPINAIRVQEVGGAGTIASAGNGPMYFEGLVATYDLNTAPNPSVYVQRANSGNARAALCWGYRYHDALLGKAYVYKREQPAIGAPQWNLKATLSMPVAEAKENTNFGTSVAIYKDYIAVGSQGGVARGFSGHVRVYKRNGANWDFVEESAGFLTNANDLYGFSVSMYEQTFITGAPLSQFTGTIKGTAYSHEICLKSVAEIYVFKDDNIPGFRDVNDVDFPGVVVEIYHSGNNSIAATIKTDVKGLASQVLIPSKYKLKVIAPLRYEFSPANKYTFEMFDSDVDQTTGEVEIDISKDLTTVPMVTAGLILMNNKIIAPTPRGIINLYHPYTIKWQGFQTETFLTATFEINGLQETFTRIRRSRGSYTLLLHNLREGAGTMRLTGNQNAAETVTITVIFNSCSVGCSQ